MSPTVDPSVLAPERAQGSAVSLGFAAVPPEPPKLSSIITGDVQHLLTSPRIGDQGSSLVP